MPYSATTGSASRKRDRKSAERHIENMGQAEEQTSSTVIGRNISLPIDEYAILLPAGIPRSTLVISGSESLPNAEKIPFQVFAPMDFLESESTAEATSGELQRLGLEDDALFCIQRAGGGNADPAHGRASRNNAAGGFDQALDDLLGGLVHLRERFFALNQFQIV